MSKQNCTYCGKPTWDQLATHCRHCGQPLPRFEPQPQAAIDLPSRFEALRKNPVLGEAMAYTPSCKGSLIGMAVMVGFGTVFTAIALTLALESPTSFDDTTTLVPWIFVSVGLGFMIAGIVRFINFQRTPLVRELAAIQRIRVFGDEDNESPGSNTYEVTLANEAGETVECHAGGQLVYQVGVGAIGVAYRKKNALLEFHIFPH